MRRGMALLAVAVVVGACGVVAPEETAPPPSLPDLVEPSFSLEPTEPPDPDARLTPDPESAYQQLLAAVPFAIASRCERDDPTRGAIARVVCRPTSGADRVAYELFDSAEALDAAWSARLERLSSTDRDGPGCGRGPGVDRPKNGRRACYREGTDAAVAWTNDLAFVLADAERADGDWAALDRFWVEAGPITP